MTQPWQRQRNEETDELATLQLRGGKTSKRYFIGRWEANRTMVNYSNYLLGK